MMVRRLIIASLTILINLSNLLSTDLELVPDFTVMIPMRDGTELPTDLYFPDGELYNLPCVLMRCPAGRHAYPWRNYAKLAHFGYVIAIQDTRSALDKEGKSLPYWTDGWGHEKDGYDTVEWLARSTFTNGRIGTIGFSAVGITQQMMAPSAPPSLKCQYIGVAAGSIYHHAVFPGGQLLKNQIEGWLGAYAKDPSIYNYLSSQPHYNEFWSYFDSISMAHEVTAPAIHYGGWYDIFIQGTLDSFVARQNEGKEGAKGKQKLIIGPWTHFWPDTTELGDFEVPLNAREMPIAFSPKRWFDHYLKEVNNNIDEIPAVTYYLMGPLDGTFTSGNVWKTADHWPIPSERVAFYLGESHSLTQTPSDVKNEKYSYEYDPNNPVPTMGGRNLFIESGPMDQRKIEEREDVIVFTSAPLEEDLEITGHLLATIYFSSDCDDTDVVVRFCDVYPDGKSILIADSIFRTALLNDGHHGEPKLDDSEPREVELDLWSTSVLIPKGHKLRVSVSSSNYPRFERNVNNGFMNIHKNAPIVAHNIIHTGKKYPSRINLPIIKK
ncbi:MAG: CocE/NonD family hydrolase [Chlamydiota bacterium]